MPKQTKITAQSKSAVDVCCHCQCLCVVCGYDYFSLDLCAVYASKFVRLLLSLVCRGRLKKKKGLVSDLGANYSGRGGGQGRARSF